MFCWFVFICSSSDKQEQAIKSECVTTFNSGNQIILARVHKHLLKADGRHSEAKKYKISVSKKPEKVRRHKNKILTNSKAHGNLGVTSHTHRHKLASYPAKECKWDTNHTKMKNRNGAYKIICCIVNNPEICKRTCFITIPNTIGNALRINQGWLPKTLDNEN